MESSFHVSRSATRGHTVFGHASAQCRNRESVMTRRIQAGMIVTFALATNAAVPAQDRPDAAPSGTITVTGCVQRVDDSGSLGPTIPERTPTPEQAGAVANPGEPGTGFL